MRSESPSLGPKRGVRAGVEAGAAVASGRSVFSVLPTGGKRIQLNEAWAGELTRSDPLQGGGRRVTVWELSAPAGGLSGLISGRVILILFCSWLVRA